VIFTRASTLIQVNCTRCGHPDTHHLLGPAKKCRMRIAYGWNEATKQFGGTAPCLCPGLPPGPVGCPHEYVMWDKSCVHCGTVAANEKKEAT
jgi:hypothetical protein